MKGKLLLIYLNSAGTALVMPAPAAETILAGFDFTFLALIPCELSSFSLTMADSPSYLGKNGYGSPRVILPGGKKNVSPHSSHREVFLEHSHIHSCMYCPRLLSCYNGRPCSP